MGERIPAGTAATPHPHRWAMLAGVWLAYFCFGMLTVAMAPLIGPITRDLDISHAAMGSVLGAWPLVYIVAAMPAGAALDRFGPRRTVFVAVLIIALSGVLRGLADGWLTLFLAVAVFGIGGPLISVGAPKVITLWFEGRERGLAMGIYITGPAMGNIASLSLTNSVMMPLFGGDWRSVLIAYGLTAVAGGLAWLAISAHPASRDMERRLAAEPRQPQLEVFGRLASHVTVQLMLLMSVGIFFFNHGLTNWLPEILRGHGMDAVAAGYWAAVPTAAGIVGSLLIPRLAVPERRFAILAGLFAAAGLASLLLHAVDTGPLLFGLVLQGIARGSMMTVAVLTLVELPEVDRRHAGAASGLFFSAAEVGGVAGPLTVGLLSDVTGGFTAPLHLMTAVTVFLLVLVTLIARRQRRRAQT